MITSILLIAIFIAILLVLKALKKKKKSFNFRVLTALVIGLIFGAAVHVAFGTEQIKVTDSDGKVVSNYVLATSVIDGTEKNIDKDGNVIPMLVSFDDLSIDDEKLTTALGDEALKYDGILVSSNDDLKTPNFVSENNTANANLTTFMSIVSGIYINLLKLIVIPLIFISITTAIINARGKANLGKKVFKVIGVLLITVSIAAMVGVATSLVLGIDGSALVTGVQGTAAVTDSTAALTEKAATLAGMNYADLILAPVPSDFSFMVGQGDTAALSTVIFGMFLGYAVLQIDKRYPERVALFIDFLNSTKEVVLSMVREILKITPFAIVALMATFMASTSFSGMSQLLLFVIGTYVAIFVMYIIHLILLLVFGLNPIKFLKKSYPVMLFGFGSRSSMAALGMNIQAQKETLGVDDMTADLAATFGVTIGQNGCAGIYPAMVAVLAMNSMSQDITVSWILMLILVIAISSFGIAGVGGGASFAAIAVLSIMGLPVTMAAILISVEPLLDMARTALNISDGMLTGVLVSKMDGDLDTEKYNG